jgi:hypothetical protein
MVLQHARGLLIVGGPPDPKSTPSPERREAGEQLVWMVDALHGADLKGARIEELRKEDLRIEAEHMLQNWNQRRSVYNRQFDWVPIVTASVFLNSVDQKISKTSTEGSRRHGAKLALHRQEQMEITKRIGEFLTELERRQNKLKLELEAIRKQKEHATEAERAELERKEAEAKERVEKLEDIQEETEEQQEEHSEQAEESEAEGHELEGVETHHDF